MPGFDSLFAEIIVTVDDPDLLRRIRAVLQPAGYTVRTAQSGAIALKAKQERPPALFLIGDPVEGADSFSLVRSLKAGQPFVPVIFMAAGENGAMATALNAGADEFIRLPIDNAELLARTRAMLRLKSTTDHLTDLNASLEQKVVERTRQLEKIHDQLHHAEKLASLGRLAASIAHEINNPLAAMMTYLDLIGMQLPADSPIQEDVRVIQRQANHIAQLVRNLRDFSKPPKKEHAPLVLNSMLEEVLTLASKDLEKNKIQVSWQLAPDLLPVMASAEQLSQIILNLVINARDAMPAGGKLHLRSSPFDACSRIDICDTGSGIEPDQLERIFEPFFTTKGENGTGLGLSVSYSIMQDHGGFIHVDSTPGQGTTFKLGLPGMDRLEQGANCQDCPLKQACQQTIE